MTSGTDQQHYSREIHALVNEIGDRWISSSIFPQDSSNFEKLARNIGIDPPNGRLEEGNLLKLYLLFFLNLALADFFPKPNKNMEATMKRYEEVLQRNPHEISNKMIRFLHLLPRKGEFSEDLKKILEMAQSIRAADQYSTQDIVGRVYHSFLTQELLKHESSFYTEPLFATVLAWTMVFTPNSEQAEGKEVTWWQKVTVCDFACGTGTLLVALFDALETRLRLQSKGVEATEILEQFRRYFVTQGCYGFDTMELVSLLASATISTIWKGGKSFPPHIRSLPMQINPRVQLGSLDYLSDEPGKDLPYFNYVILNPPFARSCGDNLQFGSFTRGERQILNEKLQTIRKEFGIKGTGHAGQAADFIILARKYTHPGGRFAFIVPKSLAMGPSWKALRKLLAEETQIEYLMFNFQSPTFAFSERTHLSEVMVVARNKPPEKNSSTVIVNFFAEPITSEQATDVAMMLGQARGQNISETAVPVPLGEPDGKLGVYEIIPQSRLQSNILTWGRVWSFKTPDLNQIAYLLIKNHKLDYSAYGDGIEIPLTRLGELGHLGPDRSQITKGTRSKEKDADIGEISSTPIRIFWGRDNAILETIVVEPTGYRYEKIKEGTKKQQQFMRAASELLVPETTFLPTTKVYWVNCTEPVLSNVFWSFRVNQDLQTRDGKRLNPKEVGKILALWGNTVVGVLLLLAHRQETRGPWVHWKKAILKQLPVLDPRELDGEQIVALVSIYDNWSTKQLEFPFHENILNDATIRRDSEILHISCQDGTRDNGLSNIFGPVKAIAEVLKQEPMFQ